MTMIDRAIEAATDCAAVPPAPFPACETCGQHPEVIRRTGGAVLVWHRCGQDHSVAIGGQDEAHAQDLWRGYTEERAR